MPSGLHTPWLESGQGGVSVGRAQRDQPSLSASGCMLAAERQMYDNKCFKVEQHCTAEETQRQLCALSQPPLTFHFSSLFFTNKLTVVVLTHNYHSLAFKLLLFYPLLKTFSLRIFDDPVCFASVWLFVSCKCVLESIT